MADMVLFQGAMTGLKAAADIALGLSKLKTMAEVNAKAIELQQIILGVQSTALTAQSEQAALVQRIRDLEQEVVRVKAWEAQKQRYALVKPWEGAVAYALKKSMCAGEPPHWICPHCYEDGRRSMLQDAMDKSQGGTGYRCAACKSFLHYSPYDEPPRPKYAPE